MAAIIFFEDENGVFGTSGFSRRPLQELSLIDGIQENTFILRPLC